MFKVHDVRGRFPVLPSHVHGYVVELDTICLVVDATAAISSAKQLRQTAEATGKPIRAVLMTHGHPDHFTGLVAFADLPIMASAGTLAFARAEDASKWESGKMYLGDDFPDARVFPNQLVSDGQTFDFDGVTFTFNDLGPGESDSDSMWWCEVDGVRHAFIGDVISNHVHAFFGDGHALHWLTIIDRLERECDETTQFYIGHGESPASYAMLSWQRGYINTFLKSVKKLDPAAPFTEANAHQILADMSSYLNTDELLFLLGYELEKGVPRVQQALSELKLRESVNQQLTETEIQALAREWFEGLNDHRPLVEMLPLLASDGLEMVFPEATLTTMVEFERWYQGVTRTFFDQDHIITALTSHIEGAKAQVDVTVIWKASQWIAPAATSTRTAFEAKQSWTVTRSPQTGKAVISQYTVHGLEPVVN